MLEYNRDWLGTPPEIAANSITETLGCDILVLGGGNSGVFAARKAAETGASVIVCEKLSEKRYLPLGCDMAYINADCYLEQGCEPIDPMEVLNEWQRRSLNRTNPALIKKYLLRSGECCNWIRKIVPQEELDELTVFHSWPDGRDGVVMDVCGQKSFAGSISYRDFNNILGRGANNSAWWRIVDYSIKEAQAHGAKWLWDTVGVVLCQDNNGDVTGAIVKSGDGEYRKINAKAVILACGDFSGNRDMVLDLHDEVRQLADISDIDTSKIAGGMFGGGDGSGHKMGLWAGGVMEPGPRASVNFSNGAGAPDIALIGNYPIFGGDGKRFGNESICVFGGQGYIMRRQGGERMCKIADGNWEENLMHQGYEHDMSSTTCKREWDLVREDMANYKTGPDGFPVHCFTGYGMRPHKLYAADTLEELADLMGYEGDAKQGLLDEIAHYNEMCHAGKDTDWGRDPALMNPIEKPPFFGEAKISEKNRITAGMVQLSGLMVTDDMQVRRKDDSIIGGLYAVGNCCGGRYAIQYPTMMAGNSIGIATTLGMVVGEFAAKNIQ